MLDRLAAELRRTPHRPALLGRHGWTRGELADLSDGYAGALHRRGLRDGDTIAVAVRPGGRALAVLLAAHRLGLRVAVADPTVGPDVLSARMRLAEPALVVADAAARAVAGWARPLGRRANLALPVLSSIAPVVSLRPERAVLPPPPDGDGDAVVVFTSGTTERPRGVVHTRSSLDAGMRSVHDLVRPVPGVPVVGGTTFVLLPSLVAGAPVALPARRLGRQLARLRPQATYLTPPQLRAALDTGARLTGRVYSGSAPVTASLLRRVREAGADEAWCVYALTELFPAAAIEAEAKLAYDGEGDLVGPLLPGVGGELSPEGELLLDGPARCDRYLGGPPLERVATGDVARLTPGGVVLAGRCKDMVLRGAVNIYPGLYEPSLHVDGVRLAVLVGVPAADGDERLVAVVEPAPGADPATVRRALDAPLARMGEARPDAVLLAPVPLAGRSRKPDRAAAARLARDAL